MTNVTPIKGYTAQSEFALRQVNGNKEMEERLLRIMDAQRGREDIDQRWLAVARTHLEEAFMAWNRSILRPQRIALAADEDGA